MIPAIDLLPRAQCTDNVKVLQVHNLNLYTKIMVMENFFVEVHKTSCTEKIHKQMGNPITLKVSSLTPLTADISTPFPAFYAITYFFHLNVAEYTVYF